MQNKLQEKQVGEVQDMLGINAVRSEYLGNIYSYKVSP